ncbi:MAG TPA: lipase family protein [Planctomycetaceae bacterium]|nr:lipase family protein [Planctomycetaceae bacterium]
MITAHPTPSPFDRKLAQTLLAACTFVYCDTDDDGFIPGCLLLEAGPARPVVWRSVRKDALDTVVVCLIRRANASIIAFRGTESSVLDWLKNFKTVLTPFRIGSRLLPGAVHLGFLEELQQIWEPLLEQVKSLDRTLPLYVTGHSQGGATAVLCTAALVAEGIPVAATYTFATPRSGDPTFATSLAQQNIHRVEFACDIVPHVPRELPTAVRNLISRQLSSQGLLGKMLDRVSGQDTLSRQLLQLLAKSEYATYRPIGRLTWIDDSGTWHTELAENDEQRLSASRLLQIVTAGRRLADHHRIASYEAMFQKT